MILISQPVWLMHTVLSIFRFSNLVVYLALNILVFLLSFIVDIWVRLRNYLLDIAVIPVLEWMSPAFTVFYYIFIWPWEVFAYIVSLTFSISYKIFGWLLYFS